MGVAERDWIGTFRGVPDAFVSDEPKTLSINNTSIADHRLWMLGKMPGQRSVLIGALGRGACSAVRHLLAACRNTPGISKGSAGIFRDPGPPICIVAVDASVAANSLALEEEIPGPFGAVLVAAGDTETTIRKACRRLSRRADWILIGPDLLDVGPTGPALHPSGRWAVHEAFIGWMISDSSCWDELREASRGGAVQVFHSDDLSNEASAYSGEQFISLLAQHPPTGTSLRSVFVWISSTRGSAAERHRLVEKRLRRKVGPHVKVKWREAGWGIHGTEALGVRILE